MNSQYLPSSFPHALPRAACFAAMLYAWNGNACADIFVLESGGRVEGEWVNREEQPRTSYKVKQGGAMLTVPAQQVREVIRQSAAELEYARRATTTADTVEEQWTLAEWCKSNALPRQREVHLRRIVELNPNHQQARYALGYQFVKGEWITRSDARRQEGYEFYRGKWRLPQEIEILESQARTELAEKEWLTRLRRWRRDLDNRERAKSAHASLTAIDDPIAVRPIGELFTRERVRSVKSLYADILARINNREALAVLVDRALSDPDEEVFYYCIGLLAKSQTPHIGDPFVAALKDNDNRKVTRGAMALGELVDKTAISPLIEALITTHKQIIDTGELNTTTFGSGGAAMQRGNGRELQIYHVHNQPVLDALSKLTSVDFGFDKKAWRYWYAQEKIARESSAPAVDIRRQE